MLRQVKISNFKSFKNETVFDFKKTNYKLLNNNINSGILKGVLFVGANASGKTNAIKPITLLLDLLFQDKDINFYEYICLFSNEKNIEFEYIFEIENSEIKYFIIINHNSEIIKEQLFVNKKIVIDRINNNVEIYFGEKQNHSDIDMNLLFLRKLYFNTKFEGNTLLNTWFEFLKASIFVDAYAKKIISYGKHLLIEKYLAENGVDTINSFMERHNMKMQIEYSKNLSSVNMQDETNEKEGKRIFFKRDELQISIPYFLESLGNRTFINILPSILYSINNGGMLVIDEFSSGLHNDLEELLVKLFMKNSNNAQLFFVSHSTNLLSNAILRPDQIYAVEFNGENGSSISRFSDEQPRVAQNLEKMYLSGVFGGIPEYDFEKE